MRYLIVHKDYVRETRDLVAECDVDDVVILVCGGERSPEGETARQLIGIQQTGNADVGLISVHRKYQKAVRRDYGLDASVSIATLKGGKAALQEWLRPSGSTVPVWKVPSEAFLEAVASQPGFRSANEALDRADEIDERRYPFANKAARALADYAAAGARAPAGLPQFFAERGVAFATGGDVTVSYTVHRGGNKVATRTAQWHLKEGDRTTPDDAARVYFHTHDEFVLLFRCGPHPAGDFSVSVSID